MADMGACERQESAHATDKNEEAVREFGGPLGVGGIMLVSHGLIIYLWIAWRFHDGAVFYPAGLSDVGPFFARAWEQVVMHATPTWSTFAIYWAFLVAQGLMATFIPGLEIKGLPIPSRGGKQLVYRCNGFVSWWLTLAWVAALHFSGIFPIQTIYEQFGPLMIAAMITANAIALAVYLAARVTGNAERMSGNFPYDFFMGAWLNPRVGVLDLKMWADVRASWPVLFLVTASGAVHQYETYGTLSSPMIFMVVAHFLYTNACMKGEECIPTTWDIFYEKWGWMFVFWNLAVIPFVYCFSSMYIASRPPFEHSIPLTVFCFALLFGAYYVWDTANSQRNRFRMQLNGSYVKRRAFPQLPWGTLKNPRDLDTEIGSRLLVDGWWRYARKPNYTADMLMALSWCLICGFDNVLPYFYAIFFVAILLHRTHRDVARCKRKYGADWDRYCKAVPYIFIPKIF